MLEMGILWLLQLNKYCLCILLVLESFLLEHGKRDHKAGGWGGRVVMSQECNFLLSDGSSLLIGRRNGPVGIEPPNYHPLVFSWKSRTSIEGNASILFLQGRGQRCNKIERHLSHLK